ncbi:hypothetical protein [Aestuariibacter sp. A3R04]|uniref:hypothetical protein n=1 Tax=Aestuariibacter sp. A3R04 TaxID=2841571 RepID=UPI001C07FFE4|nr:hypothetical protein [Aestuariibacter sp. A3R04]MBU3020667.1 hypothetical protein [Aestuariibacter sp. A3R04]
MNKAHRKNLFLFGFVALIAIGVWTSYAPQKSATVNTSKFVSDWSESSSKGGLNQEQSYFAVSARTHPVHQLGKLRTGPTI